MKEYLETGKFVGTHGVKGELKLEPWSDSPEVVKNLKRLYFNEGKTEIKPVSMRVHKTHVLVTLEGVDTIEKADELRNKVVYLNRNDVVLPEGKYFLQDMLGLTAVDANTKEEYGKIVDIYETRANDVYEIEGKDGKKHLFPAVEPMIERIDMENGIIEIKPIEGIFK